MDNLSEDAISTLSAVPTDDEFILQYIQAALNDKRFAFFYSYLSDEWQFLGHKADEDQFKSFEDILLAYQDLNDYQISQRSVERDVCYYHFLPILQSKACLVWRSEQDRHLDIEKKNCLKKMLTFFYAYKSNVDKSVAHGHELNRKLLEVQALVKVLDRLAMISVTNKKGIIQQVNNLFCQISGYSANELIGHDHRLLNSGVHQQSFFSDLWDTIVRGDVWRGEICNKAKDGRIYWVDASICGYLNDDGEITNYISIRTDITDKKNNEAQLQEQQMAMVSSSRMSSLGEMASGIAHEINNPLAIIMGYVSLMEDEINNPEKIQNGIRKIGKTVFRIEKIIKGLRSFAREGSSDPFEKVSIHSLILETLDLCTLRTGNLNLSIQYKPLLSDVFVKARSTQLLQVLVNLINNSLDEVVKHNDPWIKVETNDLDNWIEIYVQDSGNGIPCEVQEKMMQPFYTTKSIGRGTGLGLSISYGIMKEHGGSLSYELKDGHTCFVMKIPKPS